MYENLFSYEGSIGGKSIWILFKPDFRGYVTSIGTEDKIYSNGKISLEYGISATSYIVQVSEETNWILVVEYCGSMSLFVTERTKKIVTPLGDQFNETVNQFFHKAKQDYYHEKKDEIRLYFYNAERDWLSISKATKNWNGYGLKYMPIIPFHKRMAIDRHCKEPKQDAFILGRVRRTIGLKNYKLMDFIEPVHIIYPDFCLEEDNIFEWDEYKAKLEELEFLLEKLLEFTIKKEYSENDICCKRIAAYQNKKIANIKSFNDEILQAFQLGDVASIRKLHDVLETPMDCSDKKFELRLEKTKYEFSTI